MSSNSAPWLAGLDGTSTWNIKPVMQPTTRPSSVTHDASSLIQRSVRKQRRSLSGNSSVTSKSVRSPLATLHHNENSSIRRQEGDKSKHAPICDVQTTVQLRSKSSSPAKKTASLEWRKRLLHGKVAYGDQTDLFGPSGLDNIFASTEKQQMSSITRGEKSIGWLPKTDATMPSSPPPWPIKATYTNQDNSTISSHRDSAIITSCHEPAEQPLEVTVNSPTSSIRSNPFDLHVSEHDIEPLSVNDRVDISVASEHGNSLNPALGGLTELEQEDFSPVFISKHTTLTGKVDYAAIDSEALREMKNGAKGAVEQNDETTTSPDGEHDVQPEDESVFTDGPDSKLQVGGAQDLSLSENLPTGTPEPLDRFVQVQRGGYSAVGSFRHRPLSMEPSAITENSEQNSDALPSRALTPPLTAAGSSTTAAMSKRDVPSTPMKHFAAHNTFASERFLDRMSNFNSDVNVLPEDKKATAAPSDRALAQEQVSFGGDELNDVLFTAVIESKASRSSSPASDVPVPGSKLPSGFRKESVEHSSREYQFEAGKLQSTGKRLRESHDGGPATLTSINNQSEHKRLPASPLKNSTPKRRRTLHASELHDRNAASSIHASFALQQQMHADDSRASRFEEKDDAVSENHDEHLFDSIDASIKEATDNFLDHENADIVEDVLEQIEQSWTDSDPATIQERAEVVAAEVAKYTIRANKADDKEPSGMRKPSVTTADFFREAQSVMEYIRSRAAKKQSMLASVEEIEQPEETKEADPSLLIPKGSARIESHMRISREPSWEDRPRSGWREPEQKRLQKSELNLNRVASQLRRWQEPDVLEEQDVFLADTDPPLEHSDHPESEVVFDERAQIRITGPSSEYKLENYDDSQPNSQRSAQSSNETTRRTDNVGTLAPSAVAHLIGSEVGGMTFDRDSQRWIRTRSPEHKPENTFLNVHESHITSEDDPFREISDLVVDEGSEKRRISSPARMIYTTKRPELLEAPVLREPPPHMRPSSEHASPQDGRQLSNSNTILRPQLSASSTGNSIATSTSVRRSRQDNLEKDTEVHDKASIASDERIAKVIDAADATMMTERELMAAQKATHGTTTSAPELDYLTRDTPVVTEELIVDQYRTAARKATPSSLNYQRYNESTVPLLPRPVHQSMIEQSELSFVAPLPGDRMISVSLSLSKPAVHPQHIGRIVEPESSPLRHMSTMLLSDLPDFTVHDEDAERPSETAMARRFAQYASAEVRSRYALAIKDLTKALTDTHPSEPYWDEIRQVDLRKQSLTSLHGLDTCCSGLHAVNVTLNRLTHLEGCPSGVRELIARANQLSSLTQFSHLYNLQYADVSKNEIGDLDAFAGCAHLRELKVHDNEITDLGQLGHSNIQKLLCRRNKITHLDFAAGDFPCLTELDLCSNNISRLSGIEHLTSLETLRLDNNDMGDGFPVCDLPSLKRLTLRGCNLAHLDVSRMPNLEILDLDDNRLSSIVGLPQLEKLQVLSLRRQRLPKGEHVDVFSERLEAHTVRLSGNVLPRLGLRTLQLSVRHLELSAVGLTELPSNFGTSMSNLRTLNLNSNGIKDIRPLLHMEALQELHLAGNRISRLRKNAAVLVHLTALTSIDLRDNPITQGFYSTMRPLSQTGLVCISADDDEFDEDVAHEKQERETYLLASQDDTLDAKHLLRLDEETKLRRRVYDMLLVHSCKELKTKDGLAFEKKDVLSKDRVWDRLLALGVVRKSSGSTT